MAFCGSLFTLVLGRACFVLSSCFGVLIVVFVGLSFRSVSQTRHLLGAILRLCVCLLLIVGRGGVRFPGEVGVLVHPRLR